MIAPEPDTTARDLFGTLLAVLIVGSGAWIFGRLLARPILALVRSVL